MYEVGPKNVTKDWRSKSVGESAKRVNDITGALETYAIKYCVTWSQSDGFTVHVPQKNYYDLISVCGRM